MKTRAPPDAARDWRNLVGRSVQFYVDVAARARSRTWSALNGWPRSSKIAAVPVRDQTVLYLSSLLHTPNASDAAPAPAPDH